MSNTFQSLAPYFSAPTPQAEAFGFFETSYTSPKSKLEVQS
jgi:hypothetical protein